MSYSESESAEHYFDDEDELEPVSVRLGVYDDAKLIRLLETLLVCPRALYVESGESKTGYIVNDDLVPFCNSKEFPKNLNDRDLLSMFQRLFVRILLEVNSWGTALVALSGQPMCILRKIYKLIETSSTFRAIIVLSNPKVFEEYFPSLLPITRHIREMELKLCDLFWCDTFPHVKQTTSCLETIIEIASQMKLSYALVQQRFSHEIDLLSTTIRQCKNPTVSSIGQILSAFDNLVKLYPDQSIHADFVLFGLFQHYELFYQWEIDEWVKAQEPITNWRTTLGEYVEQRPARVNAGNIRDVPPLDALTNALSKGFVDLGDDVSSIFPLKPSSAKTQLAKPSAKCTHCHDTGHTWKKCPVLENPKPIKTHRK